MPRTLTDAWLEEYCALDKIISGETINELIMNFAITEWIEANALAMLVMQIINNEKKIQSITVHFQPISLSCSEKSKKAFLFLMESKFYMALQHKFKNKQISLDIKIENKGDHNKIDSLSSALYSYIYLHNREKIDYNCMENELFVDIKINVKNLVPCDGLSQDNFRIYWADNNKINDNFIVAFTYASKQNARIKLKNKQFHISNADLYARDKHLFRELEMELTNIWLFELINNAFEHGGEDILFYVRTGGWENRRKIYEKNTFEMYKSKLILLNSDSFKYRNFVDINVLDNGTGFTTLTETYSQETSSNLKNLNSNNLLHKLHRYALLPHTSRKKISTGEHKFRTTGLGVIAEQIIVKGGVIYIKDQHCMTYFTQRNLRSTTNPGHIDKISSSNFHITHVSAYIPIEDDLFRINNNVIKITNYSYSTNAIAYTSFLNQGFAKEINIYIENAKVRHSIQCSVQDFNEVSKYSKFLIIDLIDVSSAKKDAFWWMYDNIKKYKNKIICILVNAEISHIKLLSALIESDVRISKHIHPELGDSYFISAFILTLDNHIYIAGNLPKNEVLTISKDISCGEYSNKSKLLLSKYCGIRHLPMRTIERTVNKHRGIKLAEILADKYYINNLVEDKHGTLLSCFYDIREFLRINRTSYPIHKDILRLITKNDNYNIIVDSSELKSLITQLSLDYGLNYSVMNYYLGNLEFTADPKNNTLNYQILFSCVYSGKTLSNIITASKNEQFKISNICILLDISNVNFKLLCPYPIKIECLAKAAPPAALDSNSNNKAKYIATKDSKLIPTILLSYTPEIHYQSLFSDYNMHQALEQTKCLFTGHIIEHGHHYDFFIDVRKALTSFDYLYTIYKNYYVSLLNQKNINTVIFLEDSELNTIIQAVVYDRSNKPLKYIAARDTGMGQFLIKCENSYDIYKKDIIFLDEGIYTCASTIQILNELHHYEPKSITILVLEKRLSYNSRASELNIYLENSNIQTDLHVILDVNAPCWSNTHKNCPYCAQNLKTSFSNEQNFGNILLNDLSITKNGVLLYILSRELYKSREAAANILDKVLTHTNFNISFQMFNFIKYHVAQFVKWNLQSLFIRMINIIFVNANLKQQLIILHWIRHIDDKLKNSIARQILYSCIELVDNKSIQQELFFLLSNDYNDSTSKGELLNHAKKLYENHKHILKDSTCNKWQLLFHDITHSNRARFIERLFALLRLNQGPRHQKLIESIEKEGFESENIQKIIFKINNVLNHIPETYHSVQLKNALLNEDEFKTFLSDNSNLTAVQDDFAKDSAMLISQLCENVNCDDSRTQISSSSKILGENRIFRPLLCIMHYNFDDLLRYFSSNLIYGSSVLSATIGFFESGERLSISIKSIKNTLSKISPSQSFFTLKHMLSLDDVQFDISLIDGCVQYNITMRILGYVQI